MSNQKHTPTPWLINELYDHIIKSDVDDSDVADVLSTEDAKRIVACVNAMDGIEDPEKFVDVTRQQIKEGAKAKATLELIEKAISKIASNADDDDDDDDFDTDYDPGQLIMEISNFLSVYFGEETDSTLQELDNSILEDQAEK